jgi:probable rRNA maturation factor
MTPQIQNCQRKAKIRIPPLEDFARRLCRHMQLPSGKFTLRLSNDKRIRELNRRFRDQDKATDVLSFPADPWETAMCPENDAYLGDIIISLNTAQRQASQQGHSLETEIKLLLLHGLLHLLGYDHETDKGQMRRKELRLRKKMLGEISAF